MALPDELPVPDGMQFHWHVGRWRRLNCLGCCLWRHGVEHGCCGGGAPSPFPDHREQTEYSEGAKHGRYQSWWANGVPKAGGRYAVGKRDGVWLTMHPETGNANLHLVFKRDRVAGEPSCWTGSGETGRFEYRETGPRDGYFGVGVELSSQGEIGRVAFAIRGTPAWDSGLDSGALITAINGVEVGEDSIQELSDRIRGAPGVELEVRFVDREGRDRRANLPRKWIETSQRSETLSGGLLDRDFVCTPETPRLRCVEAQAVASPPSTAVADCREAVLAEPDAWELHYALGYVLFSERRSAEALHEFEEAVRLRPSDPSLWGNVAIALYALDDCRGVVAAMERATELDPTYFDNWREQKSKRTQYLLWEECVAQVGPQRQSSIPRRSDAPPPRTGVASGTGFVVSLEGHIITNQHVIDGCDVVDVFRSSGGSTRALVMAQDVPNDLALLQAVGGSLRPVRIASEDVRPGRSIAVLGYPLPGVLGSDLTITTGVVNSDSGIANDHRLIQRV